MDDLALASAIERLRRWDERRPSLPGEHWITAAAGVYLLLARRSSVTARLLSAAAGAALIARALSGRDGPLAALNGLPGSEEEPSGYVEVAAPWPYSRRIRVSTPRRTRYGIGATQGIAKGEPGRPRHSIRKNFIRFPTGCSRTWRRHWRLATSRRSKA